MAIEISSDMFSPKHKAGHTKTTFKIGTYFSLGTFTNILDKNSSKFT